MAALKEIDSADVATFRSIGQLFQYRPDITRESLLRIRPRLSMNISGDAANLQYASGLGKQISDS
jgi:hypothetical protein